MRTRLLALALLAVFAAGCGGDGGKNRSAAYPESSTPAGASVAPAGTALFLSFTSNQDSAQIRALRRLAEKVPALDSLDTIEAKLAELRPALGPETDVIALDAAGAEQRAFLGLTQSPSVGKLRSLLEQSDSPTVLEEIAGWHVFADTRALIDRFKRERNAGTLASSDAFNEAMGTLPAAAVAKIFLSGEALKSGYDASTDSRDEKVPGVGRPGWLAASASTTDKGVTFKARVKGDGLDRVRPYAPELLDRVPADAAVVLSFNGLTDTLDDARDSSVGKRQLGQAGRFIAGEIDQLTALFENEGVFFVRATELKTDLTLILSIDDKSRALDAVNGLVAKVAPFLKLTPTQTAVGDITVWRLRSDMLDVYYGASDDELIISTSDSAFTALQGRTLADDPGFQAAADESGMPDETAGFFYASEDRGGAVLADALESAAKRRGAAPAPDLSALRSLLIYGTVDGEVLALDGLLAVD